MANTNKVKLTAYQYVAPGPQGKPTTHYGILANGKPATKANLDSLAALVGKPGSAWFLSACCYLMPGGATAAAAAAPCHKAGFKSTAYLNKWRGLPLVAAPSALTKGKASPAKARKAKRKAKAAPPATPTA